MASEPHFCAYAQNRRVTGSRIAAGPDDVLNVGLQSKPWSQLRPIGQLDRRFGIP